MIITKTPLRISIGGGGTDLPSYYQRFGGFWISAAIDRYVYVALNKSFKNDYLIRYSQTETVDSIDAIKHPIVREVFKAHAIPPGTELVSVADIPAGTGLGSSGSFTVGLLRAVAQLKRQHVTPHSLAEEACAIEIDRLGEPIGKQDQYIATFGGITCFEAEKDGTVRVSPLKVTNDTLYDLEENLMMFFTGYTRSASAILSDQKKKSEADDGAMLANLHFVHELGLRIKTALEAGETAHFGELMHEHWVHKQRRTQGMSNERINHCYEAARKAGAIGGKLIGAGGGGFLLVYGRDREAVRAAMAREGLEEVRFSFDFQGAAALVQS